MPIPGLCIAAKQYVYSITSTSSARPISVMGKVSVFAVLRFDDEVDLNGLLERLSGFGALEDFTCK
jgi:hypothetical protein